MSINKIKLKQIDADFSGLVGNYGSGFFTPTGQFFSLSGSSVKYSELATGAFVYQTGTQNISGIKTFFSRPTLSGDGLSRLNEVITLTGNETVNGQKTFNGNLVLNSNTNTFQFSNVNFTQTSFSLDQYSSSGLAGKLNQFFVTTGQSGQFYPRSNPSGFITGGAFYPINNPSGFITGLDTGSLYPRSNPSGFITTGQSGQFYPRSNPSGFITGLDTGSLYPRSNPSGFITGVDLSSYITTSQTGVFYTTNNPSGFITGVKAVNDGTSSSPHYFLYSSGLSDGFKDLKFTNAIFTIPSQGIISATTYYGFLNGYAAKLSGKNPIASINGSGFDGSKDILIYPSGNLDNSSSTGYLTFTSNNTNGYKDVKFSNNITVNPSNGIVSATVFNGGGFSGNYLRASAGTSLNIGTLSSTDSINIQIPGGTSPFTRYIFTSGNFSPSVSGVYELGQNNIRWKNIYLTNAPITTSDRNFKCEISEIPDLWLDAWESINYSRFKFKESYSADPSTSRWHIGIIAQEIQERFQERGLDAFEIGMLCYSKWDQHIDIDGNIIPSGEVWSIRADECQFMEMALMRRSLNRLKSGILI